MIKVAIYSHNLNNESMFIGLSKATLGRIGPHFSVSTSAGLYTAYMHVL